MPGTYTPSKGDALSRVRFLCGDTDVAGTPRFSDDEVRLALRNTWEADFLYVYQADEAATAATVEARDGASRVELALSRTIGGAPQADTFDLSSGLGTDQTWELLRAVQDLGRGWAVGLASGRSSITWIEEGVNLAPADFSAGSFRRAQLLQRTWDLALTGGALDCLGVDKRQRLPLYRPRYAAAELLRMWLSRDDTLRSYSEDGVSMEWSREGVQQRIGELVGLQVLSVQSRL